MLPPAPPYRGPHGPRQIWAPLLLAAVSAVTVVLVQHLNGEDSRAMCGNHPIDVSWSRVVLTYGGLATALAALVLVARQWWRRRAQAVRPRGPLAMLVITGLLVAYAGVTAVSTQNLLDGAERSRQPNDLVLCVKSDSL